ncbi:MAG: FAD-dependent oxidoreductase, partial [Sweet potato little leaf phytoplasma]|nr:FAD-dependent oxidoreductase [Sweet potato little leaf phytoplasma]
LKLTMDRNGILTDNFLQTSIPDVYAIGDVNGKYMLAHEDLERKLQFSPQNHKKKKTLIVVSKITIHHFPLIDFGV